MSESDATPLSASLRRDAARNRERLLEAALEVFQQHGADAPLDLVAQAAGVGRGTLYRHFPDRSALLATLFEQRIVALTPVIRTLPAHLALEQLLVEICWYETEISGVVAVSMDQEPLAQVELQTLALIDEAIDRAGDAVRPGLTSSDVWLVVTMIGGVVASAGSPAMEDTVARGLRLVLDTVRSLSRWGLDAPPSLLRRST